MFEGRKARTASLGDIENTVQFDCEREIPRSTPSNVIFRADLMVAMLGQREDTSQVHAGKTQFVPRRYVHRVIKDPRVMFEGARCYP